MIRFVAVRLLQTIPVSAGLDSLIFDSHNNIIYTAWSVSGWRPAMSRPKNR